MTSAKECDRCGELYKPSSLGTGYITDHVIFNVCYYDPCRYYDLCPKCYSSFTQWLNKYKQKEEAE